MPNRKNHDNSGVPDKDMEQQKQTGQQSSTRQGQDVGPREQQSGQMRPDQNQKGRSQQRDRMQTGKSQQQQDLERRGEDPGQSPPITEDESENRSQTDRERETGENPANRGNQGGNRR